MLKAARCVLLGDVNSGKAELAYVLKLQQQELESSIPPESLQRSSYSSYSIRENETISQMTGTFNGLPMTLDLWFVQDSTISSERAQGRFSKANLFVLVFSLHDHKSFENIRTLYLPEIQKYPNISVVLVGLNILPEHDAFSTSRAVTVREIESLLHEMKAEDYLECQIQKKDSLQKFYSDLCQIYFNNKRRRCSKEDSSRSISSRTALEAEKDKEKNFHGEEKFSLRKLFSCVSVLFA